jgi:hypothetical protein
VSSLFPVAAGTGLETRLVDIGPIAPVRAVRTDQRKSTRSFARAVRQVRDVNQDRRIVARWMWS